MSEVYKILKNDLFGRYMVANKNIKKGELILRDKPVLLGPQLDGKLLCFNCCNHLKKSGYIFCLDCRTAIFCGPMCKGEYHSKEECNTLKELPIKGDDIMEHEQIYLALRCFLLKKTNPKLWEEINELEPHLELRRDTFLWRKHKNLVEDIFKKYNLLTEDEIKEELVQKMCGILDVNTFEIRPPEHMIEAQKTMAFAQCLRGLYLKAAMMAHDCLSNVHLSVDDNFEMTIHASVDIPENGTIFFDYSDVLKGTYERRMHLKEGKYFDCNCKRCEDPTEFGTNMSSLHCHKCRKGFLNPKKKDGKLIWECTQCKISFKDSFIKLAVEEGKRKVQDADMSSAPYIEKLIKFMEITFHPNHYLILDLVQTLADMYVRMTPTKNNLARRIELCSRLLNVLNVLEPGISRLRAITLFELHTATVNLAHKEFNGKEIKEEELISRLQGSEVILKESITHLLYEPLKSPEGKIKERALEELKLLRENISTIRMEYLNRPTRTRGNRLRNKYKNNEKVIEIVPAEPEETEKENTKEKTNKNKSKIQNGVETDENEVKSSKSRKNKKK